MWPTSTPSLAQAERSARSLRAAVGRSSSSSDFAHAFSHDDYSLDPEPEQAEEEQDEEEEGGYAFEVAASTRASVTPGAPSRMSPASDMAFARGSGSADTPGHEPRRHIVHIPSHLAFNGPGAAEFAFQPMLGLQHQRQPDVVEEGSSDGMEGSTDDEQTRTYERPTYHAAADAIGETTGLLSKGAAGPDWRQQSDAEGRGSRGRGRALAHMPLLLQTSPALTPSTPLLVAHDNFQHFTPGTRRNYKRQQIDVSKLAHARARRWWWCGRRSNPFTLRRILLVALLTAIIIVSASEQVMRKLVAGNMYNYRWFLFQLGSMLTFAACALAALWQRTAVRHFVRHHGVPYKFILLSSLLDCVHSLSLIIAVGVLPPSWGVVLPQMVIPMALLFRFFATDGERVGRWGALGSLMVTAGATAVCVPALLEYQPCNDNPSSRTDVRAELLSNLVILVVGLVPNAASSIYKQAYLQHNSMDIFAFNAAMSGAQFFWSFILAPVALELQYLFNSGVQQHMRAPASGTASNGVSVSEEGLTWTDGVSRNPVVNFHEGLRCLAGYDSEPGDVCESLFPFLSLHVLALLGAMAALPLLIHFLMSRSSREHLLASSLVASSLLALLSFHLEWVHAWLPIWDFGDCLPGINVAVGIGVASLVIGACVAQWEPSQQPLDLDVWARLEEIAQVEELEHARRAKLYPRTTAAKDARAAHR